MKLLSFLFFLSSTSASQILSSVFFCGALHFEHQAFRQFLEWQQIKSDQKHLPKKSTEKSDMLKIQKKINKLFLPDKVEEKPYEHWQQNKYMGIHTFTDTSNLLMF